MDLRELFRIHHCEHLIRTPLFEKIEAEIKRLREIEQRYERAVAHGPHA